MRAQVNLHYGDLVDSSNLASIMAKAHGHLGSRGWGLWCRGLAEPNTQQPQELLLPYWLHSSRGLAWECPAQGHSGLMFDSSARCCSSGLPLLDLVIFPLISLHPEVFHEL